MTPDLFVFSMTQSELNEDLRTAASRGQLEIVKQLLDSGAEVNSDISCSKMTPLMLATHYNHLEVVCELLARRASVDTICIDGYTALMFAAQIGHSDIIQELLRNGANTEAVTQTLGWTPLMLASSNGHLAVVKDLLAAGSNYRKEDKNGKSALDLAMNQDVKNAILDFHLSWPHCEKKV